MNSLLDRRTADLIVDNMPSDGAFGELAEYFGALSDITRLKILSALSASAMCVTDLAALVGLNQTTCSHQLRLLRTAKIVECRRQGKVIFYSLSDGAFTSLMDLAVENILNKQGAYDNRKMG